MGIFSHMLKIFRQYYPVRNVFFALGEGLFIFASVLISSWILLGPNSFGADRFIYFKALLVMAVGQTCLYYNDLYDFKIIDSFSELGIRLLQALGVAAIFLGVLYLIFPGLVIGRGIFVVSIGFVILFIVSWRLIYSLVLSHGLFNERIIILGSSAMARNIVDEITSTRDCGYTVSMVAPDCFGGGRSPVSGRMICRNDFVGLCEIAEEMKIKKIVVAFRDRRGAFPIRELLKCRFKGISIIDGNSFYEMLTGKLIVEHTNPGWFIFAEGFRKSSLKSMGKRLSDILTAILLLILLLPLILLTALLIKLDSRGPVIFSQERVGENRKIYRMHKFRSMVADAEKLSGPVWASDDDDRVTRVGRVIRKLRIDEIPQLWNVLKGEMSFVGPRPEREFFVKKLEELIPYYGERFTVKPGITGWAQVCFDYGASVEDAVEKLNYDLFYIKNMSLLMDLMIVARTVKTVLFGKGAR